MELSRIPINGAFHNIEITDSPVYLFSIILAEQTCFVLSTAMALTNFAMFTVNKGAESPAKLEDSSGLPFKLKTFVIQ